MGQCLGWQRSCPPLGRGLPLPPTSSPLAPLPEPVPTRALPCFFPRSYFKSSVFPVRPLARGPAGFVSTRLLKDNAQMGALVGGLCRAAGGLIQAW